MQRDTMYCMRDIWLISSPCTALRMTKIDFICVSICWDICERAAFHTHTRTQAHGMGSTNLIRIHLGRMHFRFNI